MSDNVTLPGTGEVIATDDVSTVQYQRVKLVDGTLNSTAAIPGDATNGLDVDVTRVKPDGTNTMPSLDAAARAGFVKVTDGTLTAGIIDETGASAVDAQAVGGGTAHDAVDSGNPLKMGGYAKAAAPTDVSADGDRVAAWYLRNGAQATVLTAAGALIGGDATDGLQVNLKGAGLTSLQLIDDAIFADDAAFTVGTSKLTAVGGIAVAHGSAPDAADALDAGAFLMNRHRVQFVIGGHPNVVTYAMSLTTAVSNTVIGPTIGGGAKFVVTGITAVVDNASTVFPTIVIGFGTANTPAMATTPGTAGILLAHPACPAGGGISRGDGSGILGVGADGEEVRITTTGNAGGAGVYVTLTGYTIET